MSEGELTDKCKAIYEASLGLIAEQGFHGTPMSQIAKQAGVGVGSIYRYCEDKEDLIHAVHAQADKRMTNALRDAHAEGASEKEHFFCLIKTLVKHFIDNPIEFKFMEQYYNSPYGVQKKREKFFDELPGDPTEKPFIDLLKGESFKDLPMPTLHALAFGPLIFSLRDHHSEIQTLNDELINQLAEGCWDAIRK
jgi:AcrR family transcriptional regulator